MKIIGFVYSGGKCEMVLKCDSCLLNGRKPFFIPEWANPVGMTECMILRVSRLGKEIACRYADRYYDSIAPGVDFTAIDAVHAAQEGGHPWTRALAFDYSLAIGEWLEIKPEYYSKAEEWVLSPEEAVAEASKVMTIRQGDLIYIQRCQAPRPVIKEEIIRIEIDGAEKLYCKIK